MYCGQMGRLKNSFAEKDLGAAVKSESLEE